MNTTLYCMYNIIICIACIVSHIKNLEKVNCGNDMWPENIFSMHPVGVKTPNQPTDIVWDDVLRCGWFKVWAIQPSATIMSWLWAIHTHYALSGTTCRESLLGDVFMEHWGFKARKALHTFSGEMSMSGYFWGHLKYLILKTTLNAYRCFQSQGHVRTINRHFCDSSVIVTASFAQFQSTNVFPLYLPLRLKFHRKFATHFSAYLSITLSAFLKLPTTSSPYPLPLCLCVLAEGLPH